MYINKVVGLAGDFFGVLFSKSPRFQGLEVKGSPTKYHGEVASYSNYKNPVDTSSDRLQGSGRNWGQASAETQREVMDIITQKSSHLSTEDQAILLGIARIESGFNPDAAAAATSASGVFQIVKKTGVALGLSKGKAFDAQSNIEAGVKLFEENAALVKRKFPKLSGDERAVMLYALHHDGPSLSFGGAGIARQKLIPFLNDFRSVTKQQAPVS